MREANGRLKVVGLRYVSHGVTVAGWSDTRERVVPPLAAFYLHPLVEEFISAVDKKLHRPSSDSDLLKLN